ncbi:MAG: GntR family transcriptional regulator [Eubacteriales bacterium]|nr:GntR family transcriptional regulator [Eubacteriales bacterium]
MQKKTHQLAKRSLYRDEIKEALMQAIISGELAPGDRVVESRWAKELGVSQSPIREAIRELEMIGLVENIPYKGTIVRKLTRKEIIDTYEVRIVLETMAICEAVRGETEELLATMQGHLERMIEGAERGDVAQFVENDCAFHEAYVNASNNDLLKRLWQQCYIWDNTWLSTIHSRESLSELAKRHDRLRQAIEKRDEEMCRAEVKKHFKLLISGLRNVEDEQETSL